MKQSDSVEDSRPTHIFIQKLFALTESGQAVLLPKDGESAFMATNHIGYYDDEYLYLFSEMAHKAVKKLCEEQGEVFSISCKNLLKALAEDGLIVRDGKRNTRTMRIGGSLKKVVQMPLEKAKEIADGGI